jgi:AhpD family alkylhydroperoxidase
MAEKNSKREPNGSLTRFRAMSSCGLSPRSQIPSSENRCPEEADQQINTGETAMYDIKNLGKLKRLDENNVEAMKAFWAFDKATFVPGAIDALHKQLMAVAVALTTQCPYCIELHVKAAREAGATDKMLAETATVAAAMRAGAAITHAAHLFKD